MCSPEALRQPSLLYPELPDLNALILPFEPHLLHELHSLYQQRIQPYLSGPVAAHLLQGGRVFCEPLKAPGKPYDIFSYDDYPLLWLSGRTNETFAPFARLFEQLGLAQSMRKYIAHQQVLRLYCGFFVIGNQAPDYLWHEDYLPGAQAYTLLTPLETLSPDQGHLAYEINATQTGIYRYQLGEAILLGSGFLHSTEPYAPSSRLRVLISLTFGTDQLAHWPVLKQTIGQQARYFYLPCGHLAGRCYCLLKHRLQQTVQKLLGR